MSRFFKRQRRKWFWILGVIVLLVCLRLALPFALRAYVNHQFNEAHDYSGKVGGINVHLWRGAYQIHDLHFFKQNGEIPVPFFSAQKVDLSLQWSELMHGSLVTHIIMQSPQLNFVSGPTQSQTQTGQENNWSQMLESLVPFKINRLTVTNGEVHFQNLYSQPPVDIYLQELSGTATNFTNARRLTQKLPAGVSLEGKALGDGRLKFEIHLNPLAVTPTFELQGELTNVDLTALNSFLRAYGKFDVERGHFALFTSFAAGDGKYDGYCKVFFKDLNVFEWKKDHQKSALKFFWEAVVGTVATIFKNQPKDQLAAKIPITGCFDKTDVHVWSSVATLLSTRCCQSWINPSRLKTWRRNNKTSRLLPRCSFSAAKIMIPLLIQCAEG